MQKFEELRADIVKVNFTSNSIQKVLYEKELSG
jgi:hypothetical protein